LKVHSNHILFLFTLLMFSSAAFAQEGIPGQPEREAPPIESTENQEVEKVNFSDESARPLPAREAQVIAPSSNSNMGKVPKPAAKNDSQNTKENADPLNFNFLYYVIQKFKSSDILD
jgi:hypothetical protein